MTINILYISINFIIQLFIINIYSLIINYSLAKELSLFDNLFFLMLFMFFNSIWGFIFISFKNVTIKDLITIFNNNKKFLVLCSIPNSILVLVGVVDTSINIINLLVFSLTIPVNIILNNLILYFPESILCKFINNDTLKKLKEISEKNKYFDKKLSIYIIVLILCNILTGIMFIISNNSKYGPIGIILSLLSVIINQIINITYDLHNYDNNVININNDNIETNDIEINAIDINNQVEYGLAYLYIVFFKFIYVLIIMLFSHEITVFGYNENPDYKYYLNNIYVPLFISIFASIFRIETYAYKQLMGTQFGMLININSFIVITIINFVTPLFNKTIHNHIINYCGLIPFAISIYFYYKIENTNISN